MSLDVFLSISHPSIMVRGSGDEPGISGKPDYDGTLKDWASAKITMKSIIHTKGLLGVVLHGVRANTNLSKQYPGRAGTNLPQQNSGRAGTNLLQQFDIGGAGTNLSQHNSGRAGTNLPQQLTRLHKTKAAQEPNHNS